MKTDIARDEINDIRELRKTCRRLVAIEKSRKLSAAEAVAYHKQTCDVLGLDPRTCEKIAK